MTDLSNLFGGVVGVFDYVKVSDVKAYDAGGGTFTQDAWRTRDINTEDSDVSAICSIASNQITLEAGTYVCSILCPAYKVGRHTPQLYNISDSAVALLGSTGFGSDATAAISPAIIKGKFTIAVQKTFEVQHYCLITRATDGLGLATAISNINSIYTIAEFWRIAT